MNKESDIVVAQNTFIVYGGAGCSSCQQVVQLLNQKTRLLSTNPSEKITSFKS